MQGIMINKETFELELSNKQLSIGTTDEQNVQLILLTNKGEWKEHPVLGAGLLSYLHSNASDMQIQRQIRLQLSLDNIKPKTLQVNNKILTIEL